MMRILQISASYIPAFVYGGPTMSVSQLSENLAKSGEKVTVYTTTANGQIELDVAPNSTHFINGVEVIYFKRITKDHSHLSPFLLKHLWINIRKFDIIHIHAWWNLVSMISALICILKRKKFILSPRGTLSSYSFFNKNSAIKNVFHKIIGQQILSKAQFLCTSMNEAESVKKLVAISQTHILPNFVKRPLHLPKKTEVSSDIFKLIFFSRIEEKKGLEFLLKALENIHLPFMLTIAGDGDMLYISQLKNLCKQYKIEKFCQWVGHISNEQKFDVLSINDLMVLPSYNENFANVVVESLSVGTGVLITKEVGLSDYILENDFGWVVKQDAVEIKETLILIFKNKIRLKEISKTAPNKIEEDFNEAVLSNKYIKFYKQFK